MSSSQRSSSGVRNLRAVFENADSSDSLSPHRGRSPSGCIGDSLNQDKSPTPSITRKIKSSFVTVEPSGQLLAENSDLSNRIRSKKSSVERRDIPGIDNDNNLQTTNNDLGVMSAAPTPISAASEIPTVLAKSGLASREMQNSSLGTTAMQQPMISPTEKTQTEHPEKTASAAEDQEAMLPSAHVTDKNTVSGGKKTSPSSVKTLVAASAAAVSRPRPSLVNKPTTPPKTAPSSKKQSAAAIKSPPHKAPPASKPRPKSPTRLAGLSSHLTQPTASSSAKQESQAAIATKSKSSSASQKAIGVSSHLMAPTAASKAKHDSEPSISSAKTTSTRPRMSILPKRDRMSLATSSRSTASQKPLTSSKRASLARLPNEAPTQQSDQKPLAEGFMARMMKPTSASSNKSHEKIEVKSPPRPSAAAVSPKQPNAVSKSATAPTTKPTKGKENASTSLNLSKPAKEISPIISPIRLTPDAKFRPADHSTQAGQSENVPLVEAQGPEGALAPEQVLPLAEPASIDKAGSVDKPDVAELSSTTFSKTSGTPEASNSSRVRAASPIDEWNAAALPLTPELKRENAKKTACAVDHGQRSIMDTPELAGGTIR